MEKTFELAVGVCYCLQTFHLVANMVVMGNIIYYYGNVLLLFTHKLHCLQTFDRSLHVESLDPTYVQNFRSVPPTVLRYWDSN